MAEFILNRKRTLISKTGHAILFEKGVPTFVPDVCIREAVELGAERVDAEQGAGFEDDIEKAPMGEPAGLEREELVFAAFEEIVEQNKREEFTAQGVPHVKALKSRLGFTVDNKERDGLWMKYQARKAAEE